MGASASASTPGFCEFHQKRSPTLLGGHGVVRQEVTAIQITLGQHARHTLDGRQIEIHVDVDKANLVGRDWKYQTTVLIGPPQVPARVDQGGTVAFHGLIAPSARSLSIKSA